MCRQDRVGRSTQFCDWHWFREVSKNRMKSADFATALKELANRQEYRCVYTGELLLPAVNMSLDHILPASRFPHLVSDIENVQWVTARINWMKGDYTHDEFVNQCQQIAAKFCDATPVTTPPFAEDT